MKHAYCFTPSLKLEGLINFNMRKIITAVICTVAVNMSFSQNAIEQLLTQIESNNATIKAAQIHLEADKLELLTGLNPDDPVLEADYLVGRPVSGGDQFEFTASQGFDFPTAYAKKKQVAETEGQILGYDVEAVRREVLLKAKILCINGIFLNRRLSVYSERKDRTQAITNDYEKKYMAQEISVLELNKAKIQLLGIDSELRSLRTTIRINNDRLTEMNGGKDLLLEALEYPLDEVPDALEIIKDSVEANDLRLQILNAQMNLYQAEIALSKTMALPKFEAGYHYQTVLGQTFNGGHIGMTVPLWKKKKIKAKQFKLELGKVLIEEHMNEHHHHLNQSYEQYLNLKTNLEAFQRILNSSDNEDLLNQLLLSREIDYITYAMELGYFYSAQDDMLDIEKDYHLTIAQLVKYKL